ncbi:rhodanese-like domain-containing protein [Candidatus Viridilinea mediisalina]|uniref:Rhodanese domain-containing protein n=1 Tax=Candidatus Viridilinea mediisalina TaxID=2024553 RepID=A0A2A6RMB6_9CHLR|nr:rhodanese-like domain-containing protein [Candidatus Viridilinea mediisalina]PDW04000.1 hypothetical protein CJ255_05940 [Candidatus Viridilinea mediisalina]
MPVTTDEEEQEVVTKGRRSWLPLALVGGLVLMAALVALLLTGGVDGLRPPVAATALPVAEEEVPSHGGLNPDGPVVLVISPSEAHAHFDAGTALFIDVRMGNDFRAGHIPGALTITSRELETLLEQVPEGVVLIAYGDAVRPDSGMRGAQIFMELGYPPMLALEGGFQAWEAAGYPVER